MTKRIALISCLALLAPGPGHADNLSFNTRIDGNKNVVTCSDVGMIFWQSREGHDGIVTARRDQTIAVRAPGSGPLRVIAPKNGGVWVQPSSSSAMTAIVCEAAGAGSESAAQGLLDQVRIVNEGGELRVIGPDQDWSSFVILSVPTGASLDMSAESGSLDLRGVQGRFTLETVNGPISVARVRGTLKARSANGPIAFIGHEGDMDLEAENGPVSIQLDSPSWSGKGLDGRTEKGPITMVAPAELQTGVRVQGSWGSPWHWKGKDDPPSSDASHHDDPRTVQLGKGAVLVRLSTGKGPVDIEGPGEKRKSKSRI